MKPITLNSFFIFNPTLKSNKIKPSDEELQEAKIIFYYPNTESMVLQRSNTGIIEGTIDFYSFFNSKSNKTKNNRDNKDEDSSFDEDDSFIEEETTTIKNNILIAELSESVIIAKEYEKNNYVCLNITINKEHRLNENFENYQRYLESLLDNIYNTLILFHGKVSEFLDIPEDFCLKKSISKSFSEAKFQNPNVLNNNLRNSNKYLTNNSSSNSNKTMLENIRKSGDDFRRSNTQIINNKESDDKNKKRSEDIKTQDNEDEFNSQNQETQKINNDIIKEIKEQETNQENNNTNIKTNDSISSNTTSNDKSNISKEEMKNKWKSTLNNQLNNFIESYFMSINLGKTLIPIISKMNYFPLNETSYSNILLSMRRLKEKFSEIEHTSIFYNGLLLHNEIDFERMSLIYNHFFFNLDSSNKYEYFTNPPTQKVQTVYSGYNPESYSTYFKENTSNFFKGFDSANNGIQTYHVIGLSSLNINNYQMFMPKVYFYDNNISKNNSEEIVDKDDNKDNQANNNDYTKKTYQLVVFKREGFLIFFFIKENFDSRIHISKLLNLDKWIRRYLDEELTVFKELYALKLKIIDPLKFIYINKSNHSVKISSHFFDKSRKIIMDKIVSAVYDVMEKSSSSNIYSVMTIKGYYGFVICVLNRKVAVLVPNNVELKEAFKTVEEFKKKVFDHIFIF